MAKSQTQRTREHRARVSRKAKAFDKLIIKVEMVSRWADQGKIFLIDEVLRDALAEAKETIKETSA